MELHPKTSGNFPGSKMLDNYHSIVVRESIGTFFLGVLALLLLVALQHSWKHGRYHCTPCPEI